MTDNSQLIVTNLVTEYQLINESKINQIQITELNTNKLITYCHFSYQLLIKLSMYAYMYVCMYVCIHAFIYLYM